MKTLITLAVLAAAGHAYADAQLWGEAGVSTRPAKRIEVDVSPQVRFDQDMSRFSAFLPELSARYRIARWLRVGTGYRLEYERDGGGMLVLRHRVSADGRVRYELGDVRADYRLMIMEQIRPDTNDPYRAVLRNRVDVAYRAWKPWVPYVGAEHFLLLGDFDALADHKLRLTTGVVHGRGDHDVEMFVRAELHADPNDPTFYILGLGYHYEL